MSLAFTNLESSRHAVGQQQGSNPLQKYTCHEINMSLARIEPEWGRQQSFLPPPKPNPIG
jgi:hypothetical protein